MAQTRHRRIDLFKRHRVVAVSGQVVHLGRELRGANGEPGRIRSRRRRGGIYIVVHENGYPQRLS